MIPSIVKGAAFKFVWGLQLDKLLPSRMYGDRVSKWRTWGEDFYEYRNLYFPDRLDGQTVLDVGAGCGETARRAIKRGAKEVICIESNPECQPYLWKNLADLNWPIVIVPRPFKLTDLFEWKFDLAKIDIEGDEISLLNLDSLDFKVVMEVHGFVLIQKMLRKFNNLKILKRNGINAIVSNR